MKQIAIVGVTGLVGENMLKVAENKGIENIRVFASDKNTGKKLHYMNGFLTVENVQLLTERPPDYALFATNEEISKVLVPKTAKQGTICIDNSSAFRMKKDIPLVIPCVNGATAYGKKIIANPNCTTIQTVIALYALKQLGLQKFTAVTYQAVSGAGKNGLADLLSDEANLTAFAHCIKNNVIPAISGFAKDGYTAEEHKLMQESNIILQMPCLQTFAFCVRVPVTVGLSVFLNVQLAKRFTISNVKKLLKEQPCVQVIDDKNNNLYPMPKDFAGKTDVGIGRITKDKTANAVNMFVVADNLLRGASYNAWEILESISDGKL